MREETKTDKDFLLEPMHGTEDGLPQHNATINIKLRTTREKMYDKLRATPDSISNKVHRKQIDRTRRKDKREKKT
jgi:hypothetical protein